MDTSGKTLELLVRTVEKILLPKGFNVSVREKVYNDDGVKVADFDLVVTGKLGTAEINWLIECRDRPSDGPAPGSWIEQLDGRRNRFKFNKVTAVSTTGFSPGAVEFANQAGIDIRSIDEISEETIREWFRVTNITFQNNRGDLRNVMLFLSPEMTEDQKAQFSAQLQNVRPADINVIHTSTGNTLSVLDAWQQVLNENPHLFNGIDPGSDPRSARLMVNYINPDSRYKIVFGEIEYQIEKVLFEANLTVQLNSVPISKIVEYSDAIEGATLAQSVHFKLELDEKSLEVALHRITGPSSTYIFAHSAREVPRS